MISKLSVAWLLSHAAAGAIALSFNIPNSPPANASKQISAAPVGVSLEFFTFPAYITDVAATSTCLENLKDLTGVWPPMRIGGTTQDRATYDASSANAVTYSVSDPADAPATLTYGPSFISLAAEYSGSVVLGLNRRLNDIANTISAASLAVREMGNLNAIELGNEPNFFTSSDPIANGASWTASADYASQVNWQDAVCGNLSATEIISAGVYFGTSPMSIQGLSAVEGDANSYVKDYCSHNYPQSSNTANLASLMSHSAIASQISPFAADVAAATAMDKPHVFGETNSATQGGGGISPTFGAALWIVDYVMQTVLMGTEALYFHQGTIGNCQYCWWGRYTTGAPYYGAYFATMALANADQIAPLDDATTSLAAYAIYQDDRPVRVLLYNSEYYTSGTRSSQSYTLTGLPSTSTTVTAKRLTAPYSTSRVDQGEGPTLGGQTFGNGDCVVLGEEVFETVAVEGGEASFVVGASEALLTINTLQANWIWTPNWTDSPSLHNNTNPNNTAGQIVHFIHRPFTLSSPPKRALLHFSADTRYKLFVNGARVAVGPSRSSPAIWYYDTLDIAPWLRVGENEVRFDVVRYFAAVRGGVPFQRTALPGLTVVGGVEVSDGEEREVVRLDSGGEGWEGRVDNGITFPMGLVDDVFLHINERIEAPTELAPVVTPAVYGIKTLNGELPPWRLRPRSIPMYEECRVGVDTVRSCQSTVSTQEWATWLAGGEGVTLPGESSHTIEIQADVHSTAFLRWTLQAAKPSSIRMKVTYSEGYELEPRAYPFFRTKADRLDAVNGYLIGPFDEVVLDLLDAEAVTYEPFWFRTFRIMRFEFTVGPEPVTLTAFEATQVNYPLAVKASWEDPGDPDGKRIWDVSIRTMRNCMFDGYSDCPFYEQLQYSGDSRQVGLFHYLLSGDDRLMRQAITNFAASTTSEGLTQSRFPSHVPQVIAGFSLYWILQISDHHLFFGDSPFTRSLLPRIDGVLEFFHAHIDPLGLVSNLPQDIWQYVDWVSTWGATPSHPDKGVPTSGRASNRHTYFSLLYAYVLQQTAHLVRALNRPGHALEYESRARALQSAIQTHCYDGHFFTDSTADIADETAYSQHCQIFAVLSGTAPPSESPRLLSESLTNPRFSKCSYMMRFYALRALSLTGNNLYETFWPETLSPWRSMLTHNLTTWEEDDVRQRSDCHAWGSVPIYEFCTEVAGILPLAPGCRKVLFKPRLGLTENLKARVALGKGNVASVQWSALGEAEGGRKVQVIFEREVEVVSCLPGGEEVEHGVVREVELVWGLKS
ncbi:hypothetical protein BDW59DRAFT_180787 [Aspergillus cavernicola]|uniref:Six-hairpin glycosidase-like protein n=1 Tax=Aspergillus cavernicola TaxID=176166 RepID=A0ABR4I7G0_9EURO